MSTQEIEVQPPRAGYVRIRYIGDKKVKTDNVCDSQYVWNGFGDLQDVPAAIAQRLLVPRYAAVWQDANQPAPKQRDPQKVAAQVRAAVATAKTRIDEKDARQPANSDEKVPEDEIFEAIFALTEEDPVENFDADRRPKLDAVRKKLGKRVGAQAVIHAWDKIMSESGK